MKHSVLLTITSLISILLMSFHLSDDVVRGFEPGGIKNSIGVLILVVWLYGTLVLAERRSGYIIMLLGGIFGAGVPVVHMIGSGLVDGKEPGGIHFWVWTLLALQMTSAFSGILAVRSLWNPDWARRPTSEFHLSQIEK